jgi:NAD(P)-dependent dehydrogenase (short-subunit alcohol dehydrogenase family)
MGRLDGKVCVITGAASGIGAETARLFKAEGASVVGVDLDAGAEGDLAIQADVTDSDQVRDMYARAKDELGRVDVLFNNAGISPPDDASVLDTSAETWQRVQDVNLKSVFLCCKHGIPHLLNNDPPARGSVINTASFVATMGSAVSQISYTASKGGVLALSRELGVEFARRGVRVNALCPGPVSTPLREGPGEGRAAARAPADGPLRRGRGDRTRGAVPGRRRLLVRDRVHVPRGRRARRRLPHARIASTHRSHIARPTSFHAPIAACVSARSASGSSPIRTASGSLR